MKKVSTSGLAYLAVLLCLTGCGGSKVAPVAGRVTLDGKPLAETQVILEPVEGLPEDTSTGETDADGQYALHRMDGTQGALVGTHRVKLTTLKPDLASDERAPVPRDRVPSRYRDGSLTFDVPEGGTTSADFALESR
jgi:hypothetical protein